LSGGRPVVIAIMRAIHNVSAKPRVVMSPVRTPRRCSSAFTATVLPWPKRSTSARKSESSSPCA
jgi:hypothetical protein